MPVNPDKILKKLPEGWECKKKRQKAGKYEDYIDVYFVKKDKAGKAISKITGETKENKFIKAYKENQDKFDFIYGSEPRNVTP